MIFLTSLPNTAPKIEIMHPSLGGYLKHYNKIEDNLRMIFLITMNWFIQPCTPVL